VVRVLLVLVLCAASAGADDTAEARARAHYEIGLGMYRLGDYQGALKEFAAGYELTEKPGFLVNLGQTYRQLHDLPRARAMYQKFLATAAPDDSRRGQAKQVLEDIERELRAQPPPPQPQVTAPSPAPVAAPRAVTIERPMPPPKNQVRGVTVAGIVLGVAGVGLVAGGAGAAVLANDLADQLSAADRNHQMFDPSKDDAYHLDRNLEGALLGVGGALVVTGVVLIAVGSR
jgi:tetratricopeptide (TPR) repeat protein